MTTASSPERYRRRNRWPVVIVLVLLLTAAGVIWYQALRPAAAEATGCNQPGPAPATSSATSRSTRASASGTGGSATRSASGSTKASDQRVADHLGGADVDRRPAWASSPT